MHTIPYKGYQENSFELPAQNSYLSMQIMILKTMTQETFWVNDV